MASRRDGVLYVGVTNDIVRRAFTHRNGVTDGFTKRYWVRRLVWFEQHATMPLAIEREKRLKHWPRAWKITLIEAMNPDWRDLYDTLL